MSENGNIKDHVLALITTDAEGDSGSGPSLTLPGGEKNTASNLSDFGIFKQKVGVDLQFRGIDTETTDDIEVKISDDGDTVYVNYIGPDPTESLGLQDSYEVVGRIDTLSAAGPLEFVADEEEIHIYAAASGLSIEDHGGGIDILGGNIYAMNIYGGDAGLEIGGGILFDEANFTTLIPLTDGTATGLDTTAQSIIEAINEIAASPDGTLQEVYDASTSVPKIDLKSGAFALADVTADPTRFFKVQVESLTAVQSNTAPGPGFALSGNFIYRVVDNGGPKLQKQRNNSARTVVKEVSFGYLYPRIAASSDKLFVHNNTNTLYIYDLELNLLDSWYLRDTYYGDLEADDDYVYNATADGILGFDIEIYDHVGNSIDTIDIPGNNAHANLAVSGDYVYFCNRYNNIIRRYTKGTWAATGSVTFADVMSIDADSEFLYAIDSSGSVRRYDFALTQNNTWTAGSFFDNIKVGGLGFYGAYWGALIEYTYPGLNIRKTLASEITIAQSIHWVEADMEYGVGPRDIIFLQEKQESDSAEISLNTIHRTSNGTDHVYIDQDLRVSARPTFAGVKFDPTTAPSVIDEGTVYWNGDEHTLNMVTGLGPVLQVGQELYVLVYNGTGADIPNGRVLHPYGATTQSGVSMPTVELADASDWAKTQGTLTVSTMEIPNGQIGLATLGGKVRGKDTSGIPTGSQVWLSPDGSGDFTATKPEFPNFSISLGGTLNSDVDGEIFFNQTTSVRDIFNDAHDGSFIETFSFLISSDGTTVTGTLSNRADSGRDLTMCFSDGLTTLDTTPAATVALTPGTDSNPQTNYVFIPKSTKVLTVSTSSFPVEEHIRLGKMYIQSAVTTQTLGALKNHNWNDHVKTEDDNGHLLHIAYAIREKIGATWKSGCEALCTVTTNAAAPDNVDVATTAGVVMQMHDQTVDAFDTSSGNGIHIVNHPVTPFDFETDLNTQLTDAQGGDMSGDAFSLVIWTVANSAGEPAQLMCNLPLSSYNVGGFFNPLSNAINDVNNYAVYDIPAEFQGVGFLNARLTFEHSGTNGGTWDLVDTEDLRGKIPNLSAGGAAGGMGVTEFVTLTDTPSTYVDQGGKVLAVTAAENGVEFIDETKTLDGVVSNDGTVDIDSTTKKATFTDGVISGSTDKAEIGFTDLEQVNISPSAIEAGEGYIEAGYGYVLISTSTPQWNLIDRNTLEVVNTLNEGLARAVFVSRKKALLFAANGVRVTELPSLKNEITLITFGGQPVVDMGEDGLAYAMRGNTLWAFDTGSLEYTTVTTPSVGSITSISVDTENNRFFAVDDGGAGSITVKNFNLSTGVLNAVSDPILTGSAYYAALGRVGGRIYLTHRGDGAAGNTNRCFIYNADDVTDSALFEGGIDVISQHSTISDGMFFTKNPSTDYMHVYKLPSETLVLPAHVSMTQGIGSNLSVEGVPGVYSFSELIKAYIHTLEVAGENPHYTTVDSTVEKDNKLRRTLDVSGGHITGGKYAPCQGDLVSLHALQTRKPPTEVIDTVTSLPTTGLWPGEAHLIDSSATNNKNEIAELMQLGSALESLSVHPNPPAGPIYRTLNCPEIGAIFQFSNTGNCYLSRNNGRTFETLALPTTATRQYAAYSASRNMVAVATSTQVDVSFNVGASWSTMTYDTSLSGVIRGICFGGVNGDILLVAASNSSDADIYTNNSGLQLELIDTLSGISPTDPTWFPDIEGFCVTGSGTVNSAKSDATGDNWTLGGVGGASNDLRYCPEIQAVVGCAGATFKVSYDGLVFVNYSLPTGVTYAFVAIDTVNSRIACIANTSGTSSIAVCRDLSDLSAWETVTSDTISPVAGCFIDGRLCVGTTTSGKYLMLSDIETDWRYHKMNEGKRVYDLNTSIEMVHDGTNFVYNGSQYGQYANDAAAATGGVPVGSMYVNSSTGALTVRLV